MNIPKQFSIMGHKILVRFDPDFKASTGNVAEVDLQTNMITLQSSLPRLFIHRSILEQNFLHELTHLILENMGESELSDNEKFVDMFAGLLYQCLETQKGVQ
jgi:hypothetical protein